MNPGKILASRDILGDESAVPAMRLYGKGPRGKLPVSEEYLLSAPSGDLFGLTQNAGMGWNPDDTNLDQYLILSTLAGLRANSGQPVALGYHTGHWETGLLVEKAAVTFKEYGALPFASYLSDPCDGRTQGRKDVR